MQVSRSRLPLQNIHAAQKLCWSWLVLAYKTQQCISLPNSMTSDVALIAWNPCCWTYLHHSNWQVLQIKADFSCISKPTPWRTGSSFTQIRPLKTARGFPDGLAGKESTCSAGDTGLILGLGRSPGEGKRYPLQYSVIPFSKSNSSVDFYTSVIPFGQLFYTSNTFILLHLVTLLLPFSFPSVSIKLGHGALWTSQALIKS